MVFDTRPPISGTVSDSEATVEVTIGGETYPATNNGDGTWSIERGIVGPLDGGSYNIETTATDVAGNVGTHTDQMTVKLGPGYAPTVGNINTSAGDTTIAFNGVPEAMHYEYRIDNGYPHDAGKANPITVSGLASGSHEIEIRGMSAIGAGPW